MSAIIVEGGANSKQQVAVFWFGAFLVGLFGILALPIFSGDPTALETDNSELGPFLVLAAVVLGLAVAGRKSPTLSGAAAGIAALISIVLSLVITIGVFFTVLLDDFDSPIEWGGGIYATMFAATCGLIGAVTSARSWIGASPRSWTLVSVGGAVASTAMIVGLIIPADGVTLADSLGFSVHPVVGLGFTFFICSLAAVGIAGFMLGRWGIGLLVGFFGFILVGWLASRSDSQSATFDWSGVSSASSYHSLTVIGFWSATTLLIVHVIQQFSTSPTSATPQSSGQAPSIGQWAPDPFGRFETRFFNGSLWTDHVSTAGEQATDNAVNDRPGEQAAWHPDPFARFDHRYFDGRRWTDQVARAGDNATDPPTHPPPDAATADQAIAATADHRPASSEPRPTTERTSSRSIWAADPFGRFDLRFFDGKHWTDHVSSDGTQTTDPTVHDAPHEANAGWYADPFARFEHRYFDGTTWTRHVATNGTNRVDRPSANAPEPAVETIEASIQDNLPAGTDTTAVRGDG